MARELAACLKNPQKSRGYIKTAGGVVTWLFGHVLEQVEPDAYDPKYKRWRAEDLPIVPTRWKLQVNPSTEEQFQIVKALIARADEIVHAGDPDREGQLLVDEVLDFLGNTKPVKRILLNALDETSILRANADLRDNADFFNLKQSALARSRADWLIGMNLSRAYTLAARRRGYDLVLPIGRVKTPTLALVVRREREIKNFKPVNFFTIRATFEHANGIFPATFKPSKKMLELPAFDAEGRLIDKKFAEELQKKFSAAPLTGKISSCKTTERKESQPLPFSLSTLQVAAGKAFGLSPQQVLDAAQSLYEKKLTTYPRSDCEYLPTSQFKDAGKILSNLRGSADKNLDTLAEHSNAKLKSRAWNDKKISAHHAIIPTQKPLNISLTEIELKIYNLIAKNYAVQFYPLHIYDETIVQVKYKGENFSARGKIVKQVGWREFYITARAKGDDEIVVLPPMNTNDPVTYKKSEIKQGVTKPPAHFTSSSLVQGMKDIHKYVKNPDAKAQLKDVYGIGTEATRAAIIDDLIKRGFLKVVKKILQPTEQAYLLIDALPDEMTYPDATAIWEDKLHSMSAGDGTLEDFLAGQVKFTSELVDAATTAKFAEAENVFKCPNCGSALVKRNGKNGEFWSCTNFPECKAAFDDDGNGKPDLDGKVRSARLLKDGAPKCPNCGSALVKRNGKNGEFWGCSAYPQCRTTFNDKDGKPDFDGKKFSRARNFAAPDDYNPADYEPIISSADFK